VDIHLLKEKINLLDQNSLIDDIITFFEGDLSQFIDISGAKFQGKRRLALLNNVTPSYFPFRIWKR
jgi:hypothetical protein